MDSHDNRPESCLFSSFFSPAAVICQTPETDRDKVLLDLLRLLARRREVGDIDEALRAILAREDDLPTIVAPGMAMPHARLATLANVVVGIATSENGIVFDRRRPDHRIKLIVLTLTPRSSPGAYLQAISSLARVCQDPSTADAVSCLPTAEQVWEFFDKGRAIGL